MAGNPYEDITSERDASDEFLRALKREPSPMNDAMRDGISFENLVTTLANGGESDDRYKDAAGEIARTVRGGQFQFVAKKSVEIDRVPLLLYGRLDVLKAGTIYDIKFSRHYERGKYIDSTQHPMYLTLVPEAERFSYLVSNGNDVWTETYERYETPSILNTAADFIAWLKATGLMTVYADNWKAL